MHKTAAPAKATQEAATDAVLPNASVAEFEALNQRYDTAAGYLPNNAEGDTRNAQKIEDGLQQDMTGYPPQVVQFQQRTAHLQGMLASLPEKQRQFYAGILATLNVAYQLDTHDDTRYALGQKMTELEDAVRGEATRVGNDPLSRALAQFEPPMGEAWLGKEDRESLDELGRLRDDFLDAPDADEREAVFQEASDLKRQLQAKVSVAIIEHQRSATAQWKEANGEVDRILKEAEAQTDPARRYELIGRQLFQIDPGQDALKDKVVLAFTQRMQDSPALRDKLDTWHDQVSGPLNTYSVGAPKRYTDILKNLPPVSNDYVRDLSDQYNAVLQDASTKDESITPSARAMRLAGQILEVIERVLLGLTPFAPLADILPSTLPPGVRMGLDYGSAYLGMLAGEGWGAIKEISLTGKAISSGSREAELGDRSAGSQLVKTGARGLVESSATESSLSHEAKAAERALEQKTLDAGAPPADPALEAARAKMSGTAPHPVDSYAAADVHREDLEPGSAPGLLVDAKGGNYIELGDKLLPVRFDKDNNTWRVVDRDNALRPQYPVRLNEATHRWELHHDVGLPGGRKKLAEPVRQEIVRLLKEGELSWRKIADRMGTTEDQVRTIAHKENIRNPAVRTLTPASRQEAIKLLRQHQLSMYQISRKLDISYNTILRLAKKENIPSRVTRPLAPTPQQEQETLRLLTQENQPREQVARQLGLSSESVRTIAEDNRVAETPAASVSNTRISPAIRQQITDLLHEGALSQAQIASRVGVSRWTVGRMAADTGYAPTYPSGVTASQAASVFELYDQGKSTSEIANTLELRPGRVRHILAHYNPETNKKSWWDTTPEIRSKAIAQLDAGHTRKQVAHDLGLPIETVRGIANQQRVARDNLAKELLEEGKTPGEVANSLSITPSYVLGLQRGVPEGTHDIHLPQTDLDTAMDMFGKGYTRQDVADKLGLSRWHAQSLANQYRARLMDTVTPQQLDDVARALATPGYTFRTADLAWATGLPESTVAFLEQEYANGFLVLRPQSPQAGPSWAASAATAERYEWVRPLTPEQQVQAFHELDTGHTPQEIGAELQVPDVAVEQLYAQDDPLVAPLDDPSISSPAEDFAQAPTTFTAQDEAEIRQLSRDSGLSAAFIAGWFNTTEEEIRKVLKRGAGAPPA